MRPAEVLWQLYLPAAMQYSHALLFAGGSYTLPPDERASAQAAQLRDLPPAADSLLGL